MALLPYNIVVTTAAVSKDMTVRATVKTELGITVVTDDAQIDTFIQQASSKAVELSGREFAAETMTEYFRADVSDDTLQLSRRPIKSVTSVVEVGTTLAPTDTEIIARTGWLQRINSSGDPQNWLSGKIVVVYVAGYIMLTEESNALERIVIDEVKRNYFERQRDPLVKSEEVPGVLSTQYWVERGTTSKDPMLTALEDAGFCDVVI